MEGLSEACKSTVLTTYNLTFQPVFSRLFCPLMLINWNLRKELVYNKFFTLDGTVFSFGSGYQTNGSYPCLLLL